MTAMLIAVAAAAVIALIAGLILSVASVVFAVEKDETVEQLKEILPGANCGACGYSGCEGYAAAMAHDGAAVGLCSPGGEETAQKTGEILGVTASVVKKAAVVHCGGCDTLTDKTHRYHGMASCAAAVKFYGGDKSCAFGCLGYGDCVKTCEYAAITVENGIAVVDVAACVGCGKCAAVCPKSLITVVEQKPLAVVKCRNKDKGAVARNVCKTACIGCKKCEKLCEYDAIHVSDFLASVNTENCIGCGKCAEGCPQDCIVMSC